MVRRSAREPSPPSGLRCEPARPLRLEPDLAANAEASERVLVAVDPRPALEESDGDIVGTQEAGVGSRTQADAGPDASQLLGLTLQRPS